MARRFLYGVAILIVLFIAGALALRFWAEDLTRLAFVPSVQFEPQPSLAANIYADPAMWISRPGMGTGDPARWLPANLPREDAAGDAAGVRAAVFFIHPTSYMKRDHWNAPVNDPESRQRAELFVRAMASPFNRTVDLWAPRYRQAAIGAFLATTPDANRAFDAAYADVLLAFDHFVATVDRTQPIVIAGHSQGALHTMRLLQDRVAGKPLASRVAAAYVIGWPVSPAHDLPAMGLPACATAQQAGCVVSWSSFGEPATPPTISAGMVAAKALDGKSRVDAPPLCTNPLTGMAGGSAPANANLGTLVPSADLMSGTLKPGMVPARCDERGLLLIGPPPEMGPYVLPGNDYHVYDIPLFWANLRADFVRRVSAWKPS